jgi:hypothetical protein
MHAAAAGLGVLARCVFGYITFAVVAEKGAMKRNRIATLPPIAMSIRPVPRGGASERGSSGLSRCHTGLTITTGISRVVRF